MALSSSSNQQPADHQPSASRRIEQILVQAKAPLLQRQLQRCRRSDAPPSLVIGEG
jgi:hypothetical protein